MRNSSIFNTLLVAGLVVGLFGLSFAVDAQAGQSNSPVVSWNNGSSCWITFNGHSDLDLSNGSSAPYSPNTVLDSSGNSMSVNNNCKDGVSVEVKATSTSTPDGFPNEASVLDDFEWKVSTGNSPKFSLASGASSYSTFSALNSATSVGSSSNPAQFSFSASYQYTIDNQDVAGDYSVTLQYTVSSN
jgi:hypothetical protein